jgi:uncharacterized protein (DUF58 family)
LSLRPTKRAFALAGGALALFLVGTNVQAGWVLVIAALLLGVLVLGAILPARGFRGLVVARRVPRTATAGQRVPVTISVTNTGSRSRPLISIDDDFCGRATAVVDVIRPREARDYSSRRTGARRGVHAGGECRVSSGAPFGVAVAKRRFAVSSPIVVYPRTFDAPATQMLGLGTWRAPAPVGDTSSVRDYVRGDPLRHVHWRSSARRGELMVREFDAEKRAEVTVAAEAPADADAADAVATIACSLGLSFLASGEVRLVAPGEPTVRVRDRESLLEWGARLHATGASFGPSLDAARSAPAVVCVCPADTSASDRLRRLAGEASVLAVLVTGGERDHALAGRLRAAGARVAVVASSEVDTWFADGCVVS